MTTPYSPNPELDRRRLLSGIVLAGGALALGGCAAPGSAANAAKEHNSGRT